MATNKKSVINGLLWTFLDQFSSKGISIVVSVILARLLIPEDFGMMGILYIFTALAHELVDGGLASSLIREKDTDFRDNSTIFYTNVLVSIVLYLLFFAIAPFVANYYNIPLLTSIIRVYCLIFVINSFSNVQISLLMKELKFRKIMLLNLPGMILGSLTAIYLANNNYGVWSIVYMQIIIQSVTAVLLWTQGGDIRFYFSMQVLKKHFDFGFKIMLTGFLNAAFKNTTNLVVGKAYSVKDLGYFERAKTLSIYPSSVFIAILTRVFYPVFSKIEDEKQLASAYKTVINVSFYFTSFMLVMLAVVAKPFFILVLGEKWIFAVPYFQLMCLTSALFPVQVFNLNILKVKGLSNKLFKVEVLTKIIGLITLFIGIYFDLMMLIYILFATELVVFYINVKATEKYHYYTFLNQIKGFMPTILIALLSSVVVYLSNFYINPNYLWLQLIANVLLYSFMYLVLSVIFKNKNFEYIYATLKSKLKFLP